MNKTRSYFGNHDTKFKSHFYHRNSGEDIQSGSYNLFSIFALSPIFYHFISPLLCHHLTFHPTNSPSLICTPTPLTFYETPYYHLPYAWRTPPHQYTDSFHSDYPQE
jgi:hypothetical protein